MADVSIQQSEEELPVDLKQSVWEGRTLKAKYSVEMGFPFDTTLGDNLTYWKNAVLNQDIDCAGIIDGPEGSGKSVLAMQVAAFLDVDHALDLETQVCWTPEAFKVAVNSLKKGKAIVWDEARRGLNRRRSGTQVNLTVTDMLAECRQNNLFLVMVMPSFYDMDMNVAVWRTRYLIHVKLSMDKEDKNTPLRRGTFIFYNEEGKKNLYTDRDLRRNYAYPYLPNRSFHSRFTHHYVVDEKEYRLRKRKSESAYVKHEESFSGDTAERIRKEARGEVLQILRMAKLLRLGWKKRLAEVWGCDERTVFQMIEFFLLRHAENGGDTSLKWRERKKTDIGYPILSDSVVILGHTRTEKITAGITTAKTEELERKEIKSS